MSQDEAVEVFKQSLSNALVEFYPFAGCLTTAWDGKKHVRCTGEGVQFVEATSDDNVEDIGDVSIADHSLKLRQLIHYLDDVPTIVDVPLMTVQVTKFKCGGVILGTAMNHVLLDGKGSSEFLLAWSQIARGEPLSVTPFLDHSIFAPRKPLFIDIQHPEYVPREKKRLAVSSITYTEPLFYGSFCFGPQKIAQLRKIATENSELFESSPTNFELLSALVWIYWTKAFQIKPNETSKMLTAVDSRTKWVSKPVPPCFFGNGIVWSCAQCKAGELLEKPFPLVVKIAQDAIKKVDENYVQSAIDYYEMTRGELETENAFHISKWSALPFYDIEFGFGKPVQVAPAALVDNLILAISQGKGTKNTIVSLSLPKSVMAIFSDLMEEELKK
jgi:omega-hydroxypalmitate O-feruloyl transferase